MSKINLKDNEIEKIIECISDEKEVPEDLLIKLSPGFFEKLRSAGRFDYKELDKFKIPILEYAGKRTEAVILAQAALTGGAAPLQVVRSFGENSDQTWKNVVVQGDNLQFLKTCYMNQDPLITNKVKGKVKLVYIDPPFATKSDFQSSVGAESYSDKIDKAEFLEALRERLVFIKELLAEDGFLILHLDYRCVNEMKILLDELFGKSNFRNEIILKRSTKSVQAQFEQISSLAVANYTLLFYSKNNNVRIPKLTTELNSAEKGKWDTYWRSPNRPTMRYEIFGIRPERGQWRWEETRGYKAKENYEKFIINGGTDETLDDYYIEHLERTGEKLDFVRLGPSGSVQYFVPPRDSIMANNMWIDISSSSRLTGYPTEKSEALLNRCILWLTKPNDLIMDVFAGSGTTAAVSEKLGRRWIACDFGKHAIYTIQKRLLSIGESDKYCGSSKNKAKYNLPPNPFDIISAGAYDFSRIMNLRQNKDAYITFVLSLFGLIRGEIQEINKFRLPNIYALKNSNPVEIYPVWEDEFLKNIRIDEDYLKGIINASAGKLKGDYYIITPETCTIVGNTIMDNLKNEEIHFHILKFPYKILEDVSRQFQIQEQPCTESDINRLVSSTGFYFNEEVKIKAKRIKDGFMIEYFSTNILNENKERFSGFKGLSMILINYDYDNIVFNMDTVIYAKDISDNGFVKISKLNENCAIIAIDRHGNESKIERI